jgi:hypothetical protein
VDGMRHRVQVIHDCKSRLFAEVVDAGDVEQVVEAKAVTTEFHDLAEIARSDCERCFAAKFSLTLKLPFKRFFQRLDCVLASHLLMTL